MVSFASWDIITGYTQHTQVDELLDILMISSTTKNELYNYGKLWEGCEKYSILFVFLFHWEKMVNTVIYIVHSEELVRRDNLTLFMFALVW